MPSHLSLTPFGWAYLPIVLAVLVFKREWLLPLLIVSAVLHAPAVALIKPGADVAEMGITPWLITASAVAAHLSMLIISRAAINIGESRTVRILFLGWSLATLWGILSAFVMPHLFAGVLTYNPEVMQSLAALPSPLSFRWVAVVQASNLAILWMVFFYILQIPKHVDLKKSVAWGLGAAGILSLALSAGQRALMWAGVTQPGPYQDSLPPSWITDSLNPSYVQTFGYVVGDIKRANWPFSEPSYAGVWFGAIFSACLFALFFSKHHRIAGAATLLALAGVCNSMSGSGIAGALASVLILLACITPSLRAGSQESRRRRKLLTGCLATIVILASAWSIADHFESTRFAGPSHLYQYFVHPRLTDHMRAEPTRSTSNTAALTVIADTFWLGTGLGGNRASSNLLSMASTLGIPATLLFYALLLITSVKLMKRRARSTTEVAVTGGLLGATLGVIAGIPDVLWPAWWVWIIASFALLRCAPEAHGQHHARENTPAKAMLS